MNYSFDVAVAEKYGVEEAIVISNFQYWIAKNRANEVHNHDGHTWTYNTHEAFTRIFPFWSQDQIRRTLKRLEDKKVIITGQFNDNPYDHKKWYAFMDEKAWLPEEKKECQNDVAKSPDRDLAKSPDRNGESGTSLGTVIKLDNKTDNKHPPQSPINCGRARVASFASIQTALETFWSEYPRKQNKVDVERAFVEVHGMENLDAILKALSWQCRSDDWNRDEGRWIPTPANYLRDHRWLDQNTDIRAMRKKEKSALTLEIERFCARPLPE